MELFNPSSNSTLFSILSKYLCLIGATVLGCFDRVLSSSSFILLFVPLPPNKSSRLSPTPSITSPNKLPTPAIAPLIPAAALPAGEVGNGITGGVYGDFIG